MADQILKLQPIPISASVDDIKSILKDFKVSEVSIRGDAAYVKFKEFAESEKDLFEFTFETNKYDQQGWDANLTLLPVSDWDSEQGEVIQQTKQPSQAEELKKSENISQVNQETETITVPQEIAQQAEAISEKIRSTFQSGVKKAEQVSLTLPVGIKQVKEQVGQFFGAVKQEINKHINFASGNVIPQWVWPLALAWTMFTLSFCHDGHSH